MLNRIVFYLHVLLLAMWLSIGRALDSFMYRIGAVAYANTITGLLPTIFEAMDTVGREVVGMIPSVAMSASAEMAAVGQVITSFAAPASTASNVTPGVTPPDDGDQTIGNVGLTITKARRVPVRWNGEQSKQLNVTGGPGRMNIMRDQFTQAMRTLCNEIEADLCGLHTQFSRATGTAGTTPFASTLTDPAQARKILVDNGSPITDASLVIDTTSGAALRTLAQLTKVNEAGGDSMLRQGLLLPLHNFAVRESGQIKTPTKGTGTSYTTDTAGYAVGATVITLITGSGTVVAGDVVTFAGDTNKYLVTTGAAAAGPITLAAPGLRVAITTSATAMTIGTAGTRNLAFDRNAIRLALRAPARPAEGDLALDVQTIQDPRSGLVFEIAMYAQYRQMQYEVAVAWGQQVIKPQHTAVLLG